MAISRPRTPAPAARVPVAVARREARIAGAFALVICAIAMIVEQSDRMYGDTLMNLYAGRYIWQHGLPHTDPFTVAGQGRAWIDTQWLANLFFYAVAKVGGVWLVGKVAVASVLAGVALLWLLLWRIGASFRVQALAPVGVIGTNLFVTFPRAQNLVIPLFVAVLWLLLDEDRANGRPAHRTLRSIAAILAILVLWANLHGTAVMAAGLVGAYALYRLVVSREPVWSLLLVGAPLTVLATPYGFGVITELRAVLDNPAFHHHVLEWQSAWQPAGRFYGIPSIWMACVVAVVAVRRRHALRAPLAACIALLSVATVFEARYSLWLAIAAAVALGELSASRRATRVAAGGKLPLGQFTAMVTAVVATGALVVMCASTGDGYALAGMPIATTQVAYRAAQADPHAVVLGDLDSSAMMLWLHPDMDGRLEFDPRQELYTSPELERWYAFSDATAPGWFSLARGARIVVSSKSWSAQLTRALLRGHRGWRGLKVRDGAVLVRSR